MDRERYQIVRHWFQMLNDLTGEELTTKLNELQDEDAEIQAFVRDLLECDPKNSDFLESGQTFENTLPASLEGPRHSLPRSIGPYEIREELGSGGMGVVYKAYDPTTDRLVAVKVLRSHQSSVEYSTRFRREARAAAGLRHPNIVTVYATGTAAEGDYIVMQHVEGSNLHASVKKQLLPERRAAHILSRLCEAVGFAHECGVVHRDIKPGNVMLSEDNVPLLLDFGLAKPIFDADDHTQTGQILGTVGFMAPEQITNAKSAGVASDIYGLGATLYFCLTGRAPIEETNPVTLLNALEERMPIEPNKLRFDLSRGASDICMRCLQREPRDRYASTQLLRDDLQRLLADEPLSVAPDSRLRSIARILNNKKISSDLPSAPATSWIAMLAFAFHLSIFFITQRDASPVWLWIALGFWFLGTNAVNYVFHWSRYWQLTPMERQSGLTQLGVNLSLLCLFFMHGPLHVSEPVDNFLAIYPPYTLLFAVALVVHGSIFEGRLLLASAFFFPLAFLNLAFQDWSPIVFCVFGTFVLVAVDILLRRITQKTTER